MFSTLCVLYMYIYVHTYSTYVYLYICRSLWMIKLFAKGIYIYTHMYIKSSTCIPCVVLSRSIMSDSLQPCGLYPTRFFCPWNFPGKNTGVSCHFFLQGIFPIQGSKLHLLHLLNCRQILFLWAIGEAPVEHLKLIQFSCKLHCNKARGKKGLMSNNSWSYQQI